MKEILFSKKGMTLVEMMVSVFLFGILSSAAYLSLEMGRRSGKVGEVEIQLQQGARKAMTEMLKEIRETDAATVRIYPSGTTYFQDPQNSRWHQAIAFASARGNPLVIQEGTCIDDVPTTSNACFHIDGDGRPSWRALVVVAPYQTPDGRQELRRYVSYNTAYASGVKFPFTFTSITATLLNLRSADSAITVSFNRDGSGGTQMRVLAENVETEDTDNDNALDSSEDDGSASLPFDNNDGRLNHGVDFSLSGRMLTVRLFLRKREMPYATASQFVVSSLSGSVQLRNE